MTDAVGDTGHTDFMTPGGARAPQRLAVRSPIGVYIELDDAGQPKIIGVFDGSASVEKAGLVPA